jgi:hypothetical protein
MATCRHDLGDRPVSQNWRISLQNSVEKLVSVICTPFWTQRNLSFRVDEKAGAKGHDMKTYE